MQDMKTGIQISKESDTGCLWQSPALFSKTQLKITES